MSACSAWRRSELATVDGYVFQQSSMPNRIGSLKIKKSIINKKNLKMMDFIGISTDSFAFPLYNPASAEYNGANRR